mmetsp:Transcript_11631/g.49673  ORF Transcript_11631/g.49673 Transcript_11631/m.49673 type:complete len:368 (-) Transcript_11631:7099-8202(-)
MAHRELVVEVHRGLAEARHHLLVVRERRLDQLRAKLLAVGAEVLQVAGHERAVNLHQRVLPGEVHREGHEQPLQTGVDGERARGGVHARHVLRVFDLLQNDLVLVVPAVVVHELPRELDGRLRVVLVHERHVHVVEEVHELFRTRRAETHAGFLLQRLLDDHLQRRRVHEVVHVHRRERPRLAVQVFQGLLHERRLARARVAHEHAVVLVRDEPVEEETQARALDRWDEDVGESFAGVVPKRVDAIRPGRHLPRRVVHVVVEHQAAFGEEHVLPLRKPPLAELRAVVHRLVHEHRAAQRPHRRVDKLHLDDFLFRGRRAAHLLARDEPLQDLAHRARDVHGHQRHDRAEVPAAVLERLFHVPVEEFH